PDRARWLIEHPVVPNEELYAHFCAADLGVWPGNLSQVVLEALACALPVVLPEEISPGYSTAHLLEYDNGRRFRRGDVPGLRAAVTALIDDPAGRRAAGERARRLVEDR